jgi:hypothetical protein
VVTSATTFTLKVTVSDGRGGTVQGQVNVAVAPPSTTNTPPTLTSGPSTSAATIDSQQSVNLSVSASDSDGDTLTYSWSQTPSSPGGSFGNASTATPSWRAPTVTADTAFQLRVTVTDGRGGSVSGSVTVNVRAPPPNRNPTLTTPTASPTNVTGAAPVQLSVTATDPDGDPLTYAWTQTPSSPAGSFSNPSVSNPTWTSPVVASNTTFTLRVTVTDGREGTASGQVNVAVAPPIPQNNPPTLTGLTASPTTLNYQQQTTLSLTASDPDSDPITYAWTQEPATPAGSFSSITAATPTWTAPRVTSNTSYQLRVTVSDDRGGSTNGSAAVTVNAFVNSQPTLTGPTASATTIFEQTSIDLGVTATDPDSDPLTYTWTQTSPASPLGTFSNAAIANPSWTAPNVTEDGTYTLRVVVSDGQGGSAQGTINITVERVNQPPTVGATISGPTTLLAGTTGTFSITASDPDGDTLNYSWSNDGAQGTFVGNTNSSSVQWFSSAIGTQTSFTLNVYVSDGGGDPPVGRTITFPVTVPNYSVDVRAVWSSGGCTGCHGGSGGLNLGASSYANLVNVSAAGSCSPTARVLPNDPDNSALILKMEGTSCGSGNRMPQGNPSFFDTNRGLVIRVRSWILAGAPNN